VARRRNSNCRDRVGRSSAPQGVLREDDVPAPARPAGSSDEAGWCARARARHTRPRDSATSPRSARARSGGSPSWQKRGQAGPLRTSAGAVDADDTRGPRRRGLPDAEIRRGSWPPRVAPTRPSRSVRVVPGHRDASRRYQIPNLCARRASTNAQGRSAPGETSGEGEPPPIRFLDGGGHGSSSSAARRRRREPSTSSANAKHDGRHPVAGALSAELVGVRTIAVEHRDRAAVRRRPGRSYWRPWSSCPARAALEREAAADRGPTDRGVLLTVARTSRTIPLRDQGSR
jgi:hypothetical protein